jgi:hypothetical protein
MKVQKWNKYILVRQGRPIRKLYLQFLMKYSITFLDAEETIINCGISDSHGGEYEDELSYGLLRRVIW